MPNLGQLVIIYNPIILWCFIRMLFSQGGIEFLFFPKFFSLRMEIGKILFNKVISQAGRGNLCIGETEGEFLSLSIQR